MFINNINGVINKNLSLFFFRFDIKLEFEGETKTTRIDQKLTFFFISLFFFLKIQDITKSKAPIFKRR